MAAPRSRLAAAVALVLSQCAADLALRRRPLAAPRRQSTHAALQLRGGGGAATAAAEPKHTYIEPRELTQLMVADLAPHGMLPLAWAATRGAGTGVVPTVALLAVFASASAYTLFLCARLAEAGREAKRAAPALSELWRGAQLPLPSAVDAMVALLCGGCCVFYAAFAADLLYALTKKLGFGLSREVVLGLLTCVPLAPLCLGDDLSVLKYSSLAGLVGIAYTASFIGRSGNVDVVAPIPSMQVCSGTLVLANTMVVAFLCHYNAVQYYRELAPPRRTPDKFRTAVVRGAALTALVFAATLFGGARAFGDAALPNVLNNYDADSAGATVARLGTGVAILSGFPLMFAGLKAALDGCVNLKGVVRPATHGSLLAVIAAVAARSSEEEIGLIIELLGSTLGVAAAYVVPGLCAARSAALEPVHRRAGAALALAGLALCVGGTYLTLKTHA